MQHPYTLILTRGMPRLDSLTALQLQARLLQLATMLGRDRRFLQMEPGNVFATEWVWDGIETGSMHGCAP